MLSDYLRYEHHSLKKAPLKKDIIAYNPVKGIQQTRHLIKACPQFDFVPIQNMSSREVAELLMRTKLYIDFGFHPGKDRLPREAALAGCCLIIGKKGAAAYYQDIPIKDGYKLDDSKLVDAQYFTKLVNDIFISFEQHQIQFKNYVDAIAKEKSIFKQEVKDIFLD